MTKINDHNKAKRKMKERKGPFELFGLSYRYGLPFINIFLFSYCCGFTYF